MPTRTRHAYLDRCVVSTMSQERFERITDPQIREPYPGLAGRRIRFITLFVEFDGDVAVKLTHVEPVWITFDDEGRRDEAEAARARHATVDLLEDVLSDAGASTIVPAARRFVSAGLHWEPTADQLDSVLSVHGLRKQLGTPPGPPSSSNHSYYPLPYSPEPEPRHLRLVPERRPITSAELSASLTKQWASWHPDPVCQDDYLWLAWDNVDSAVRHLAWIVIDKLYDDLTAQGLVTGEIVTFAMFPATIEGQLP